MAKKAQDTLFSVDRLVTYSDALFAFAATLLVLGLKIPTTAELGTKRLGDFLAAQWPAYLSFFISFIIITVVWLNHHSMFFYIRKADHTLLLLNSLLLFDIVAIPFGAGLLGQHLLTSPDNARMAELVYGGIVAVGGIPFNLVWWYGTRDKRFLGPEATPQVIHEIRKHFHRGPFLYLGVTLLAFWNVWVTLAGFLGLILLFIIPATWALKRQISR